MAPGMVGSVNYGSGRRAYNPQETVAGKTGTCIGDGGWVGLFTSYAPLANPRLAVVVIARGTDAHGHFPAAVAGQIYRDLSSRFGTPTNLQIANQRDSIMRSDRPDPKAALNEEDKEANLAEADEADAADNNAITRGTNEASRTSTRKVIPSNPIIPANNPVNNTVRRVLMPIPNRNQKPVDVTGLKAAPKPTQQPGQRSRRVRSSQP
jgi:hypothetical protein